jgi:hypothetical protein
MFSLRLGLKAEWVDTDLPDNTAGWRSEWFYIVDQLPGLPCHTGHKPVNMNEWGAQGGPGARQRCEETGGNRSYSG